MSAGPNTHSGANWFVVGLLAVWHTPPSAMGCAGGTWLRPSRPCQHHVSTGERSYKRALVCVYTNTAAFTSLGCLSMAPAKPDQCVVSTWTPGWACQRSWAQGPSSSTIKLLVDSGEGEDMSLATAPSRSGRGCQYRAPTAVDKT